MLIRSTMVHADILCRHAYFSKIKRSRLPQLVREVVPLNISQGNHIQMVSGDLESKGLDSPQARFDFSRHYNHLK